MELVSKEAQRETLTTKISTVKAIDEANIAASDLGLGEWVRKIEVGEDVYGNKQHAFEFDVVTVIEVMENEDGTRTTYRSSYSPCGTYTVSSRVLSYAHERRSKM